LTKRHEVHHHFVVLLNMNQHNSPMEEAARWFAARRRNLMTLEERAEFERWAAIAENRSALESMERAWRTVGTLTPHSSAATPELLQINYGRRTMLRWAGSALAASAAGLFVANRAGLLRRSTWDGDAETGIGEQKELTLADGSVISLNVMSKLRWRLSGSERRILLESGDALFTVAKDADRPFLVQARGGAVRVLGTVFSVSVRAEQSSVAVQEGHVALTAQSAGSTGPQEEPLHLVAGQAVNFRIGQVGSITAIGSDQVGEWRDHFLSFSNATLGDVLSELGRYFPVVIRIDPPALAARRITLRLKIADQESTLTLLGKLLGARVEQSTQNRVVLHLS
jgi:transmembrane sensor